MSLCFRTRRLADISCRPLGWCQQYGKSSHGRPSLSLSLLASHGPDWLLTIPSVVWSARHLCVRCAGICSLSLSLKHTSDRDVRNCFPNIIVDRFIACEPLHLLCESLTVRSGDTFCMARRARIRSFPHSRRPSVRKHGADNLQGRALETLSYVCMPWWGCERSSLTPVTTPWPCIIVCEPLRCALL